MAATVDQTALEERLMALEAARTWSPRVVSRLEAHIRTADDYALFRINPMRYAAQHGVGEAEAIDLFLHAVRARLFDMDWVVVCALCGNMFASLRSLERVDPHFRCDLCGLGNEAALDDQIQVTFTVSPSVRSIAYHDPASLSAEDLYFRYRYSPDTRPTAWGPTVPELLRSITRYLGFLGATDTLRTEIEASGIQIAIRDVLHGATAVYRVGSAAGRRGVELDLRPGGFVDRAQDLAPFGYELPAVGGFEFSASGDVSGGATTVAIANRLGERAAIWIVDYPASILESLPIEFEPILSAKQVLSTPTFRSLFRSETVAASEGLAVKDLTFLFTDLKDSTAMYDRIGDATAYNLVRQHFDLLEAAIREHRGALVKTIGDAVMATFVQSADAVRAALDMIDRTDAAVGGDSVSLVVKVGIHRGRAIAVTSNDRLDYFGQTVNIAGRVQSLAAGNEVLVSDAVFQAAGVADVLAGRRIEEAPAVMKGVAEEIRVHRVTSLRADRDPPDLG